MSRQTPPAVNSSAISDFQPDAEALRREPLPWWARCGVAWLALCLLLALVWACVGKVDVIVTAPGKIVSLAPTLVMKPLERSVVQSISVAVGERVQKGQELMAFDPAFSEADEARLHNDIRTFEARFERLRAEFDEQDYAPTSGTDESRWQKSIFSARKTLYAEKLRYYAQEMQRREQSRTALRENLGKQKARLAAFYDIESMLVRARNSQTASPRDLKELQISRMQAEAESSDAANRILELGSELAATEADRNAFVEDWRTKTAEEMVEVRRELIRATKEYDKVQQIKSYVILRAPEEAIVHEIAPVSVGSAVREAENLITLVPLGGTLEVEAEVPAQDIGRVDVGDAVRIKLSAFPFQQFGTVPGEVRVLSEDTFQKPAQEEGRPVPAVYRARVALLGNLLVGGKPVRLIPGMEVQSEIRTGERRIIQYLLNPLIKSLDEALREP